MTRRTPLAPRLGIAGVAAAALVAGAASAQVGSPTNPTAPPGNRSSSFTLSDTANVAVLQYHTPRELQICNQSGRPAPTEEEYAPQDKQLLKQPLPDAGVTAVPLQVSYQGITHQIAPGECYSLNTAYVRIELAQPLPADNVLTGTVEWLTPVERG